MARRPGRRGRKKRDDVPDPIGTDYPAAPSPGGSGPGLYRPRDDDANPFLDPLDTAGPLPYAPPPSSSPPEPAPPEPAPPEPGAPSSPARQEPTAPTSPPRPAAEPVAPPQPRRRRGGCLVAVLVVLVVVAIAVGIGLLVRAGSADDTAGDSDYSDLESLDVTWEVRPDDVDPAVSYDGQFADGVDGTAEAPFVVSDDVWVVRLEATADDAEYGPGVPDQLAGIDPATGRTVWLRELPGVRCDDGVVDGALTCLAQDGAGAWSRHVVDAATGEDREVGAVSVAFPRIVHATPTGLLVVSDTTRNVATRLSLLAADGTVSWTLDLADLPNADDLLSTYENADDVEVTEIMDPTWRDVGDAVLLAGWTGFVLLDPDSGVVLMRSCWDLAATAEAAFCHGPEGTERIDPDGSIAWHANGPILPNAYSPAVRPLALDGDAVWSLDEATGEPLEELVDLGPDPAGAHVSGTLEHSFVIDYETLARLTPDGRGVVWSADLPDLSSITQALVVGDVVVLDGFPFMGVDLDTGELLWTRSPAATDAVVVDGTLVAHGPFTIAVHVLPD